MFKSSRKPRQSVKVSTPPPVIDSKGDSLLLIIVRRPNFRSMAMVDGWPSQGSSSGLVLWWF